MVQLTGKVAIVTGAGSGQGFATATTLAEAGASVLGIDVNAAGLAQLEAEAAGVVTAVVDVRDAGQVEAAVSRAEAEFGGLDAVLNCAGVLRVAPFEDIAMSDYDFQFDVNVRGVFNVCRAAIPALKRRGGGSIVNWGSANSLVAEGDISVYCATKGAVLMFSKALALEYGKDDIRVNCLCMSGVTTSMLTDFFGDEFGSFKEKERDYQPLGLVAPEDVANVAKFLVSDDSRMMTGSAVMVDGGYTAK